ncbi:putative F-box/kelch-repeat protein At1g12870 [Rosa rugosa]|uniref:putative F-box/kelch-repeat protein At1g12870 n=1 Tax=Rosa rugosa TaxID=74645 RepID=UPI002B41247B|nr:putative F-box/kelch-repeat protein At1g12870 [Rosa rugosa]
MGIGISKLASAISCFTSKQVRVPSSLAGNQDLVREILSKLPVKSLVRFRCVSKEWYALLNQEFILNINRNYLPNLCLLYGQNIVSGHHHHEFSLLGRKVDTLSRLEFTASVLDDSVEKIYIVGSSNGLVCLHFLGDRTKTKSIIVWNPVTEQYRKLPKPLSFEWDKLTEPLVGFGFIQDHGMNSTDYKVVRISRSKGDIRLGLIGYVTQVFTRSAKSWRVVKECNPSRYLFYKQSSITLNGVLYSLAWTRTGVNMAYSVFSFNLQDEVFHNIQLPQSSTISVGRLFVWNNLVAYSTWADHSCQYDVWVMTTESRDDTQMPTNWNWTKQVTIKPPIRWYYGPPSGVWNDQFIFYKGHTHSKRGSELYLYTYDLADQKERMLLGPETDYCCLQVVDYVESLVPV